MPKGNAAVTVAVKDWKINKDNSATITVSLVGTVTDENGKSVIVRNPVIQEITIPAEQADVRQGNPLMRRNDPRMGGPL